jgi:hypothetical protein
MPHISLFSQHKRPGAPGIGIIILGFVLFVLIFFLEYTYSDKRGDLVGSIIYVLPFSGFLTASFLLFVRGSAERRQTHLLWHRQKSMLGGLLFLSISLIFLVELIDSLMHGGLPDTVGLPIAGVGFLLVLLAMIRRSKIGTQ